MSGQGTGLRDWKQEGGEGSNVPPSPPRVVCPKVRSRPRPRDGKCLCLRELPRHQKLVPSFLFSPDGLFVTNRCFFVVNYNFIQYYLSPKPPQGKRTDREVVVTVLGAHSPLRSLKGNAPIPVPCGHGSLPWPWLPAQLLLGSVVGAGEAGHGCQGQRTASSES